MSRNTGLLHPTDILGAPDFTQSVVLSSGTAQAFDTPTGMAYVGFSMNYDFWTKYGSTGAVVPTTSSTASSGSELNPTYRNIGGTQTCTGISIVSDFAAKGSLNWYRA